VDVRERIGIQDHQVRDLALLQGTQVVQAPRRDRAVAEATDPGLRRSRQARKAI
jgi:hypothetical protein